MFGHQHNWGGDRGHGGHGQHGHGHGHGGHGFGGHGWGFGRQDRPGDMPSRDRVDFDESNGEGDSGMFGNGWEGRGGGGPRGRGPQGFGFGRGPGRPERALEQGDLRWIVLDLIAAQPRHGYEIIKAIEEAMNGHYTPSPGVIYPTLTYLEETGMIASEAQATKKLYSITDEGRTALNDNAAAVQSAHARIEGARARFGGPPAPEMHRAMENLRAAIQVRLAKGELSPESLAAVTAALDRAASEIERS